MTDTVCSTLGPFLCHWLLWLLSGTIISKQSLTLRLRLTRADRRGSTATPVFKAIEKLRYSGFRCLVKQMLIVRRNPEAKR